MRVYRFPFQGRSYILKESALLPDNLSPFWYAMREIYGTDFALQRKNIRSLLEVLRKNPHIETANLVYVNEEQGYQVFEEAAGRKYEPDNFPDEEAAAFQLGQYIGYLHRTSYESYGVYPPEKGKRGDFTAAMVACMEKLIQRWWKEDKRVKEEFERIRKQKIMPSSYSLIMTDISANQFVFSEDLKGIKAVVDFDAYVVGPREWELTVLEGCLKSRDAFRRGYEIYRKMPDLNEYQTFYLFFSYLCDPWENMDLDAFLHRNEEIHGKCVEAL